MAAKRNKTANDAEAQAAAAAAAEAEQVENAQTDEPTNAPEDNAPEDNAPAEDTSEAINADEMAAAVKVGGNSYQQYARQMFKERLEESR